LGNENYKYYIFIRPKYHPKNNPKNNPNDNFINTFTIDIVGIEDFSDQVQQYANQFKTIKDVLNEIITL
jgi:hypothetical protein